MNCYGVKDEFSFFFSVCGSFCDRKFFNWENGASISVDHNKVVSTLILLLLS